MALRPAAMMPSLRRVPRCSGHADYVISKAALNYMSRRCLARPGISHLAAQGGKSSLPISRLGRNASGGQDDFRNETGR